MQIKTGKSYFSIDKVFGWEFKGETKHLNYYLNSQFPILIIMVDLDTQEAYWTEFKKEKISPSGENWKIEILKSQRLEKNSKEKLQAIAGPMIDYLPQLKYQWEVNKKMKESALVMLAIERDEIESLNFAGFETLLKNLKSSYEMVIELRGKITFLIYGYGEDERELFQIPEVRDWVKQVIPIFKYWGYFLNMDDKLSRRAGLKILQSCCVDATLVKYDKKKGYHLEFDPEQTVKFMENLFVWLNEICEEYNINNDINFEQSMKIIKIINNLTTYELNKLKRSFKKSG